MESKTENYGNNDICKIMHVYVCMCHSLKDLGLDLQAGEFAFAFATDEKRHVYINYYDISKQETCAC